MARDAMHRAILCCSSEGAYSSCLCRYTLLFVQVVTLSLFFGPYTCNLSYISFDTLVRLSRNLPTACTTRLLCWLSVPCPSLLLNNHNIKMAVTHHRVEQKQVQRRMSERMR